MVSLCSRAKRLAIQLTLNGRRTVINALLLCGIVLIAYFATRRLRQSKQSEYSYHETLTSGAFEFMRLSLPKLSGNSSNCISPELPLYNKLISDNRPSVIPADLCDKSDHPNWLQVSQSRVLLKQEFSDATCSAEPIVRVSDDTSEFSSAQPIHSGSELPSLGFRATCTSRDSRVHKSVYYGINRIQLPTRKHTGDDRDNIIIIGLDSLSRLESLRSLQQVSRLMQSELDGVTLMQYNILGDGTPAALLPILTGVREQDMPEGRRGFEAARHLDESMRWIFQDLRDLGYLTLYGEEESVFGTFQTRFTGFKQEPANFYLRPALQKQEPLQTDSICIGNEFSSARMLHAVQDLFTLHPNHPKFAFLFFSTLSHENKDLTPMDSELTKFINWFMRENLMRNTSIILMSDHGQRHGPMRNSMQGKLEESLPLMTIALSHQLMSHRAAARQMLIGNSKRLTTPLDIHRTLMSVAGVTGVTDGRDTIRSYSLIDEAVPETRKCSDAGIPTHWCSCLHLSRLSNPDSHQLAVRAARYAVSQMNTATDSFRHLCEELRLQSISSVDVSLASNDLAKRERYVDWSYMAYNVENKAVVATGYLSIRFVTEPNNGLFEATVQFSLQRSSARQSLHLQLIGEASRINRYGSQADCVVSAAPHLRKFCLCRSVHT